MEIGIESARNLMANYFRAKGVMPSIEPMLVEASYPSDP